MNINKKDNILKNIGIQTTFDAIVFDCINKKNYFSVKYIIQNK